MGRRSKAKNGAIYLEEKVGQMGPIGFLNNDVELRPSFAVLYGAKVSASLVYLSGRPIETHHLISDGVNAIG